MLRLTALAAAALTVAGLMSGAPAADAAPRTVLVKGRITSTADKPLRGVTVSVVVHVTGHAQPVVHSDRTARNGRYEVRVPVSTSGYALKVRDAGDADRDQGDGAYAPLRRELDVHSGTVVANARLHRGATVTGRVSYDGTPAKAGLLVQAESGDWLTQTYTRAGGAYRFGNLPSGATIVMMRSPSRNGSSRYYTTASSHGVFDGGQATELELAAGSRTSGISVDFPAAGRIAARITIDGRPGPDYGQEGAVPVAHLLAADGTELYSQPATGEFQWLDLAPGTYYLRFDGSEPGVVEPEYYADSATLAGATAIVLHSGEAITDIVAHLQSAQ